MPFTPQYVPKQEFLTERRINSKLMHENIALKKEIADLKKEVERLRALIPDEEPMEEDFVLTDDEEEVEEDTRPRICPLELERVKKTLTQVWASEQRVWALPDIDEPNYKEKKNKSEKKSFWEITTKELLGEYKAKYYRPNCRDWVEGEYYQIVRGINRFAQHPDYHRQKKYHLNAKEKALSKKLMEERRADPKKLTTTADIRARAKAEGYTITKGQEKTLQEWEDYNTNYIYGFAKMMERKVIYAYEYAVHYTKGGGMRVMSHTNYSASFTRYNNWEGYKGAGGKGQTRDDYMCGNIILRKKK